MLDATPGRKELVITGRPEQADKRQKKRALKIRDDLDGCRATCIAMARLARSPLFAALLTSLAAWAVGCTDTARRDPVIAHWNGSAGKSVKTSEERRVGRNG